MNAVIWLFAGGIVGALAFHLLHLNTGRGFVVAVLIGVFTAYLGGSVLSPLFSAPGAATADFNPFALMVASCTALVSGVLTDSVHERFGT